MAARSEPVLYHPVEGDVAVPGATAISEFFGFAADCGQAAAEVIYSWASGQAPSGPHINAVVSAMQQAGLAGGGGVSTLQENSQALALQGIPNTVTSDWQTAISQFAGVKPVEIGVANARALPGDELTVQNHFLTVVGRTAQGNLIVSDPDNAAAKAGKLNVYTPQQIANALPWGAIVPTGTGAGGDLWQSLSGGLAGAPATAGTNYVTTGQAASQAGGSIINVTVQSFLSTIMQGLGIKNVSDALWMGGLIVLGGLLLLAGLIVFILPNQKKMATGAQVVGAVA